ncbi:hypothetical protein ACVWZ4_003816 [Bradyrhizobium sp. USDA 4472]
MGDKGFTEAERLELLRSGKTACIICGDVMDAFGGGKTRKKYCSVKCKDRSRKKRINDDARSMGAECYRIWLALPKGEPRKLTFIDERLEVSASSIPTAALSRRFETGLHRSTARFSNLWFV